MPRQIARSQAFRDRIERMRFDNFENSWIPATHRVQARSYNRGMGTHSEQQTDRVTLVLAMPELFELFRCRLWTPEELRMDRGFRVDGASDLIPQAFAEAVRVVMVLR